MGEYKQQLSLPAAGPAPGAVNDRFLMDRSQQVVDSGLL